VYKLEEYDLVKYVHEKLTEIPEMGHDDGVPLWDKKNDRRMDCYCGMHSNYYYTGKMIPVSSKFTLFLTGQSHYEFDLDGKQTFQKYRAFVNCCYDKYGAVTIVSSTGTTLKETLHDVFVKLWVQYKLWENKDEN
jgi:hypothetical protein